MTEKIQEVTIPDGLLSKAQRVSRKTLRAAGIVLKGVDDIRDLFATGLFREVDGMLAMTDFVFAAKRGTGSTRSATIFELTDEQSIALRSKWDLEGYELPDGKLIFPAMQALLLPTGEVRPLTYEELNAQFRMGEEINAKVQKQAESRKVPWLRRSWERWFGRRPN